MGAVVSFRDAEAKGMSGLGGGDVVRREMRKGGGGENWK